MSHSLLLPPPPSSPQEEPQESPLSYHQEVIFIPSRRLHLDEDGYALSWLLPTSATSEYIQTVRLNSEDVFPHQGYLCYTDTSIIRLAKLSPQAEALFESLADRREFFYTSLSLHLPPPGSPNKPGGSITIEIPTCEIDHQNSKPHMNGQWYHPLARKCYRYTAAIDPLQIFPLLDNAAAIVAKTRYHLEHVFNKAIQPIPKHFIIDMYCSSDTARYSNKKISDNEGLVLITLPLSDGVIYTAGHRRSMSVDYDEKTDRIRTKVPRVHVSNDYPDWLGADVTHDHPCLTENYLHRYPFGEWPLNEQQKYGYPRDFPTE